MFADLAYVVGSLLIAIAVSGGFLVAAALGMGVIVRYAPRLLHRDDEGALWPYWLAFGVISAGFLVLAYLFGR